MAGNTSIPSMIFCWDTAEGLFFGVALMISRTAIIVPLCILVLHVMYQQWRQQRSSTTTGYSHTDVFTFHMISLEMVWAIGGVIYLCGRLMQNSEMFQAGLYITSIFYPGQISFHALNCIERYLAVVHPVLYLRLRSSDGVKIRNLSIASVWIMSFTWSGATALQSMSHSSFYMFAVSFVISLTITLIFSLRVVCVLIRPGPGDGGRVSIDQSKRRAFYTIIAIMSVQGFWYSASLVTLTLEKFKLILDKTGCLMLMSVSLLNLPCSLVLPLLFLHRAGKVVCCCSGSKVNHETGS